MSQTSPEHAQQFADDVNSGGVSYHLLSRQFVNVGSDHGYMVGGHPNAAGEKTPEVVHEGELTPDAAGKYMDHAVKTFGSDPVAHAGGWAEKGNSVLDISTRFDDRRHALLAAHDRGERAIFDVHNIADIDTPERSDIKKPGQKGRDARSVFLAKAARGDYSLKR